MDLGAAPEAEPDLVEELPPLLRASWVVAPASLCPRAAYTHHQLIAGSTELLYDGGALVAEYDSAGNVLRRFVHGPATDEPIVWYEGAGTTDRRWLHADERGSAVAISDGSGTGTVQTAYSAYGETDMSVGPPLQYTGQLALPQLNLYYYKARFYAPKLGRFLQPDPIGYAAGVNLYGYSAADPVNRSDPSGLDSDDHENYNAVNSIPAEEPLVTLVVNAKWTPDYHFHFFNQDDPRWDIDDVFKTALAGLGTGTGSGSQQTSTQQRPCGIGNDAHGTLLGGVGGSLVGGIGAEASGGGYLTLGGSSGHDYGGYTTEGGAGGFNVSAGVFGGYMRGNANYMRGDFDDLNLVAGPISLTLMYEPSSGRVFSGRFAGFTLGVGPGVPGGVSVAKSNTQVISFANAICRFRSK